MIYLIASLILFALVEMRFQNKIKNINQGKNIRAAEDSLYRLLNSNKSDLVKQMLLRDCYSDPVAALRLDPDHLTAEQLQTIKQMIEQHLAAKKKK